MTNLNLVAGLFLLTSTQGVCRTDSVTVYTSAYEEELPQFFHKTRFEPADLVKDSAMLAALNANAIKAGSKNDIPVHMWNWNAFDEMPYYFNLHESTKTFELPAGNSKLSVIKTGKVITCDEVAENGIRLTGYSAKVIDSIFTKSYKYYYETRILDPFIILYPFFEYYLSGKVLLNENFDSYLVYFDNSTSTEHDFLAESKACYLINVRSGHLLSVAKVAVDYWAIDAGVYIYGYMLDDGTFILQEINHSVYSDEDITDTPMELPIDYYIYRVTDEGTFRQLLPPEVGRAENKQP